MAEQYVADLAGTPLDSTMVANAQQVAISIPNETELYRHMATLIDRFAPKDGAYAEGIRVTMQP